jgi:hypothetical protein
MVNGTGGRNGYDASSYAYHVIERYEARDEARRKYHKGQQLKKLEDDEEEEDGLRVDEAKGDKSKQMDFAKIEKRVRTTGGGSTGTVRCGLHACVCCTCIQLCTDIYVPISLVFGCYYLSIHFAETCVFRRTRQNVFWILMSTLHIMIPNPGPCVKILCQMQILVISSLG